MAHQFLNALHTCTQPAGGDAGSPLTASARVRREKMGSRVTSMVTWLLAVPGKAKTFMWQDFKAYRGGLLVVRSTRSHKVVARRMHTPLRACAVLGA